MAVGLLLGTPLAGLAADRTSFEAMFLAAAILLMTTAGLAPRERLDGSPLTTGA